MRTYIELVAMRAADLRARAAADAAAEAARRRDRRIALVEAGLRDAISRAPDVFPVGIDTRRLAARVVDELIGG
jgi:hypothetical protein